jgi:hypothetical protein
LARGDDDSWLGALEALVSCGQRSGLDNVLPACDMPRLHRFVDFWESIDPPPSRFARILRAVSDLVRARQPQAPAEARPPRKPPFAAEAHAHTTKPTGPDLAWLREFEDCGDERGGEIAAGVVRVAGRLRERLDVFRAHTTDAFVLGVVENGLELPLLEGRWPDRHHDSHNFVREEDMAWVRETVAALVNSGAVQPWSDLAPQLHAAGHYAGARPHVIMPVLCGVKASSTPTDKKLRFIHDCRFLNDLLEK